MSALGALFVALTFFDTGQLFCLSIKLLDYPTQLVLMANDLCVDGVWGTVGDHLVNVAVSGYLKWTPQSRLKAGLFKIEAMLVRNGLSRCMLERLNVIVMSAGVRLASDWCGWSVLWNRK